MSVYTPEYIATVSWTRHTLAVLIGREQDDLTWGVPDLTPGMGGVWCDAMHSDGAICTRQVGHTGRHAAGNGEVIVAVWP